mmetsp:Transcript_8932/g.14817  ORF Transcript_8932/g.14817 Transcript_8932/m.14817 type:complete len:81 (-) Transcript_8932:209-451(-)
MISTAFLKPVSFGSKNVYFVKKEMWPLYVEGVEKPLVIHSLAFFSFDYVLEFEVKKQRLAQDTIGYPQKASRRLSPHQCI